MHDPLTIPTIDTRASDALRSEIIAAAYGSDMPTWLFEELVAALYPEEFAR